MSALVYQAINAVAAELGTGGIAKSHRNEEGDYAYRGLANTGCASCRGCSSAAHVRTGTDGGTGLKPSDRWAISLCSDHHREQHLLGEAEFQRRYDIDLYEMAAEFARKSPQRGKFFGKARWQSPTEFR